MIIAVPVAIIATILTAAFTGMGCTLGNGHFWGYWPGHIWGKVITWAFLLPVKVEGRENIEEGHSYVFVANHQGQFDIFLIYGFLNRHFKWMMKYQLRKMPCVGYACEKSHQIFVDRRSPSKVKKTIDEARATLKDGMSLVIFPEGARTFTGKMGPFKKGAYQLALEFNLPLVPVTIDGSFAVLPRTRMLPRPGHIELTIHPQIAAPTDEAARGEVIELTRKAIESALPGGREPVA